MARFNTSGLDDLVADMMRHKEQTGPVAEEMVNAAVEEIAAAWKTNAEAHGLRDTGAMIESIGYPDPVQNIGGALARDVYPVGKDSKGVRNAEKAFILNYGSSTIPATHWIDDADEASGPVVQERLEAIWERHLRESGL